METSQWLLTSWGLGVYRQQPMAGYPEIMDRVMEVCFTKELIDRSGVLNKQYFCDYGLFGFCEFMAKLIRQDDIKALRRNRRSPLALPKLSNWGWAILLATMGGCLGWVPSLKPNLAVTFTTAAQAQDLWPKVPAYVNAVFEVEPVRIKYWQKIQGLMNGKPIDTQGCASPALTDSVKQTCQRFFRDCGAILEKHRLTRAEFNQMQNHRTKQTPLGKYIEQEILKRQQQARP